MDRSLRSLAPILIGGALLFAVAAWGAYGVLPAWSLGELKDRGELIDEFGDLAQHAGVGLLAPSEDPSLTLVSRDGVYDPESGVPEYGPGRIDTPVLIRAAQEATRGDEAEAELVLGFSPSGDVRSVAWMPLTLSGIFSELPLGSRRGGAGAGEERRSQAADRDEGVETEGAEGAVSADSGQREIEGQTKGETEREATAFARLLVPEGRTLEPEIELYALGTLTLLYPLTGTPPAHIELIDPPVGGLRAFYRNGEAETSKEPYDLTWLLLSKLVWLLVFLAVAGIFLAFLGRRRIDLINGALLATLAFLSLLPAALLHSQGILWSFESLLLVLGPSMWVLLLWSTGESWLRALEPDFDTSLDALRVGRLGPRGGKALLAGLGLGAGLAGVRLLVLEAAELVPWLGRSGLSVRLPIFGVTGNPLANGILVASEVLLVTAICLRFLPRRWALAAAALLATLVSQPVPVDPLAATLLAGLPIGGGLVYALRRYELTGLLSAAVTVFTLPAVAVAIGALEWMPGSFAISAGLLLTAAGAGMAGLGREEEEEARGMGAPAFVRRLEDEKRLQHEMGLLARMQLGLLPASLPRMDGWEISARSVLATEVGGDLYDFLWEDDGKLWVAAGDVSGHGYSCAIIHAMTKAALASLVTSNRTPGEVLTRIDRVLRTVRYRRAFTSLALLRLDPRTGEGMLANAGHPFPLLFSGGQVHEIELPGLPLGQGPERSYADHPLRLEAGSVLVLCSDGLFEATDREVRAYGFERPRRLLASAARWPSNEVVEMLLADWRRHRGPVAAADDTTVVVIKRLGSSPTSESV